EVIDTSMSHSSAANGFTRSPQWEGPMPSPNTLFPATSSQPTTPTGKGSPYYANNPMPNTGLGQSNPYVSTNFAGYTYGPGYWGKTFYTWPPNPDDSANPVYTSDPNNDASTVYSNSTNSADGGVIKDWRQRFYWKISNGNYSRLDDNN